MKKLKYIGVVLLILILSVNCGINDEYEDDPACDTFDQPSESACNNITQEIENPMNKCCFVSYKYLPDGSETRQSYQRCKLLENTEYGINQYKKALSKMKSIVILCNSEYLKSFFIIGLYLFLL